MYKRIKYAQVIIVFFRTFLELRKTCSHFRSKTVPTFFAERNCEEEIKLWKRKTFS